MSFPDSKRLWKWTLLTVSCQPGGHCMRQNRGRAVHAPALGCCSCVGLLTAQRLRHLHQGACQNSQASKDGELRRGSALMSLSSSPTCSTLCRKMSTLA